MLGSEAEFFIKTLGDFLTARWEIPYGVVMGWVGVHLSSAILRVALLCVRGSRTKWRSLGIFDGAFCQLMLLTNPFVLSLVFSILYMFVVSECFVVYDPIFIPRFEPASQVREPVMAVQMYKPLALWLHT